ncbi:MAG: hypothetical protein JST58_14175 [Bacteroidetes bacterium]|nr:hypothetical protein [Bacteroidota bacterium]
MKTNNFLSVTLLAVSLSIFFACKKDSSQSSSSSTSATNIQTAADDQTMSSNENDAVSSDATAALNANVSIAGASYSSVSNSGKSVLGMGTLSSLICDATVTYDTTSTSKTITIVYNGTNCEGNRTRRGTVIIAVPKGEHWKDVGATVNIKIDTLIITRVKDGKTITLNGSKTITNVSGGLLVDLASTVESITHNVSDTISITFANGNTRNWMSSKQRVFTYNNGLYVSTTGTGIVGANSNVAEWGTNRFGVSFQNLITAPKQIAQSCGFDLISGQDSIIRSDNITSVITYGLDANGAALTACPTSGYIYAKLVWSNGNNGKQYTFIYPY